LEIYPEVKGGRKTGVQQKVKVDHPQFEEVFYLLKSQHQIRPLRID
jgi:hypothetical protein